ncbi:polynucleotide 5'-hydroxyl-kinase NOL9 [Babesia caballi]|uniref:Polynucleotide 5'-hydroxyl-kinase NOL9 n=1 Tax=Babesia caballi TaxID=5871 RepID=A0AAV4LYS8_BABCB|nr:polynucleotide 5'-hydroxyl-kinase NOL9 [Babesia caballi]
MLALCAGGSGRPRETGDGVSGGSCEDCRRVLAQQVLGGTCCDVRARHAEDDALMERHFNVGKRSGGAVEVADDPDVEALKHHEAEQQTEVSVEGAIALMGTAVIVLQGAETTVVAIVPHRSAFGSVDIGRVFAAPGRPKIVVPALVRAARALLEVCARGERPPVLMLHGDKGAGKSTAAVYIVNYLLNHVGTIALLDTDVGQPIFGPPATVSLKFVTEPINAAPHALLAEQRPEVAYLLGDVKVTNPATMLRHTHKCFEIYRNAIEDDRGVPLVVNTFGWVSGLGAKMLECIGAITRTAVMLKLNTKQPSGDALPTVSTHRELETVIAEHTTVASEGAEPSVGPQADVLTMYRTVVEECGATLPWDRSGCVVIEALSHTQASALVAECVDSLRDNYGDQVACSLGVWRQARVRRGGASADPAPGDLRWLRACALINPSFGDCLHFPQLQQEEFFGAVGTPAFRRYVRYPELFRAPRQMVLMAEKFSFVVQINTPLERLEEVSGGRSSRSDGGAHSGAGSGNRSGNNRDDAQVCPVVAGSMVALCCGHSERTLGNEVGEDWEFVAFVRGGQQSMGADARVALRSRLGGEHRPCQHRRPVVRAASQRNDDAQPDGRPGHDTDEDLLCVEVPEPRGSRRANGRGVEAARGVRDAGRRGGDGFKLRSSCRFGETTCCT